MEIRKRWLLLPVSAEAEKRKICFMKNGKLFAELKTRLSLTGDPDFVIPYDAGRFIGEDLEICTDPGSDYVPEFADSFEDPGLYLEEHRPVSHFTSAYGWINDPNGPVYYEGRYHLFFQHNPADSVWGNMHWGHAVSSDLLHWRELPSALFPKGDDACYSGSAVVDWNNVSGLQTGNEPPLLIFSPARAEESVLFSAMTGAGPLPNTPAIRSSGTGEETRGSSLSRGIFPLDHSGLRRGEPYCVLCVRGFETLDFSEPTARFLRMSGIVQTSGQMGDFRSGRTLSDRQF